ncbi:MULTISPECIES: DUF3093 domain-containing protein [unclassified Brachybacterium]|uniref:DUF3093 domain-containing protein n=1 Tax=unclassified Brachybacterium TaxID=2623841 RepID=UPI00362414A0
MPDAVDPHTASPTGEPAPSAPNRPRDQEPLFRERLLPGPGTWVVVVALGSILGVVIVPLHLTTALVVGVVSIIVAVILAVLYSPVLEVKDGWFTMGRARIEVDQLGEATVLRGDEWRTTMGQGFEPLAHHCVRGWVSSGFRIEVLDDEDPTTAWVGSSRRPDDLALALRSARRDSRSG